MSVLRHIPTASLPPRAKRREAYWTALDACTVTTTAEGRTVDTARPEWATVLEEARRTRAAGDAIRGGLGTVSGLPTAASERDRLSRRAAMRGGQYAALWAEIGERARVFDPASAGAELRYITRTVANRLAGIEGCGCRSHHNTYLNAHAPNLRSRRSYQWWWWRYRIAISKRIGKRRETFEAWAERWGWES